jgi:Polysaccharide pyruvyl transferase
VKTFDELMARSPASPFGVFSYYCDNLGDHIQTLALLQHVTAAALLPRDHLTPRPDLVLLANGWMSCGRLPAPGDFRDVRYIGIHLAWERRNPRDVADLARFGAVGCRDSLTRDYLGRHGFPAVLTGCATSAFPPYDGVREGVYGVDVSDDMKDAIVRRFKDPVFLTHDLEPRHRWRYYPEEIDDAVVTSQFERAYAHLSRYRQAEVVITSRVHVALPSAAFGTPVLYVGPPESWDDRVGILTEAGISRIAGPAELSTAPVAPRNPHHSAFHRARFLDHLERLVSEVAP